MNLKNDCFVPPQLGTQQTVTQTPSFPTMLHHLAKKTNSATLIYRTRGTSKALPSRVEMKLTDMKADLLLLSRDYSDLETSELGLPPIS